MATKVCRKCKKEKDLCDFNKSKERKDGHKIYCKECTRADRRVYRLNHLEKEREQSRIHARENKNKRYLYAVKNKDKTDGYKRKYIENNPQKRKEQCKKYYEKNKEKIKEKLESKKDVLNAQRRIYNATHPQARIAHNQRTRIGACINGRSKGGRLHLLIGCDINFFIKYLESNFQEGMTWANYGRGLDKWSIDHTIPLEYFNLEDENELKQAFHWANCKPMWYSENASKGAFYNGTRNHLK
jgi:hypothetical protein